MREGYMNLSTDVGNGIDDGGPEGARRATGGPPSSGSEEEPLIMSPPDPEVPEKKARRKFTAKYKLQILQEADACTEPSQLEKGSNLLLALILKSKELIGDLTPSPSDLLAAVMPPQYFLAI